MTQITAEPQLYQWLKTEKAGDYSYESRIEEDAGITYMIFDDGSRINVELIGEFVQQVDDEEDGFIIKEEVIEDITITKGVDGKEYEIPGPEHGKIITKKIPKPKRNPPPKAKEVQPKSVVKEELSKLVTDPVIILLEKAKKEKHTYDIELNVDAISKDLYRVVKDTFEDGEDKSLDYIVSLIDMDKLKVQLKEKLKSVYNGEGNTISE